MHPNVTKHFNDAARAFKAATGVIGAPQTPETQQVAHPAIGLLELAKALQAALKELDR